MAHEGIFATSAEVLSKCGKGYDAVTAASVANINQFCAEAESYINALCQYNFSDAYATLNADTKKILTEACSCLAAINIVKYDTDGYSSQRVAENIININWFRFQNCVKLLNTQSATDWVKSN